MLRPALLRARLLLCFFAGCSLLPLDAAQAKKIDGDELLDPDRLLDIRIELADDDWQELRGQTRSAQDFFAGAPVISPFTWFKADLWIDGEKIKSVGVRKKGLFGSSDVERPSLKIKFDEYRKQDPVKGLDRLTLNNNKQDVSQVSQILTYRLFNQAGIQAPRCSFARVTVNGEFLGIYSNVESIRKPFLKRRFGDSSGNLYEGTLTDVYPKTVEKLEAKTNRKNNDRKRLALLAGMLAGSGELKIDQLDRFVDVDEFVRHWVMEGIIRFWDGYASNQNNDYLYENPADGRFHIMPWGADGSFTDGGPFASFNRGGPTAIYAQGILANRLYHTPGMPERYRSTMLKLLDEVWKVDELVAEIDRYESLLGDHLHERQSGMPGAMERVREFIRSRPAALKEELDNWPAQVPAEPRKPQYTVDVGKVSGSFETTWLEGVPEDPATVGQVAIDVELDGAPVTFKQVGVTARAGQVFGFGRRGGNAEPPVSLVFTATREEGDPLRLLLTVDRKAFLARQGPITVTGRLSEGQSGFSFGGFGGARGRSMFGTLILTQSGTMADDPVSGDVSLKIVEVRGGFFGGRRNQGPPPPRVKLDLAKRIMSNDADKDGKVTREELPGFLKRMLDRGDTNKDGALDEAEARALAKKLGLGATSDSDDQENEDGDSDASEASPESGDKSDSAS